MTEHIGHLVHALSESVHIVNSRLAARNISAMFEEDTVLMKVCADGFKIVKEVVNSAASTDLEGWLYHIFSFSCYLYFLGTELLFAVAFKHNFKQLKRCIKIVIDSPTS